MTDAAGGAPAPKLTWRRLTACDLPELTGLYTRALAADGGQPFAADEWLLRRWFIEGVEDTRAALVGDRLVGACAWRYTGSAGSPGSARPDGSAGGRRALIVGQVDPEHRRDGIGGRLLDAAIEAAGADAAVRVETESLSPGADELYRSRGLTCVFAEDVMTRSLADRLPEVASEAELAFTEWSDSIAERFFAVYEASFRDRPGFPGWTATEWIGWITDDDDFRPDWTLLASQTHAPKPDYPKPDNPKPDNPKCDYRISGERERGQAGSSALDVGFVAGGTGGWIAQVGVVPAARRHAVASRLIAEVLRRMQADGESGAVLNVNVNNPAAIAAYIRLGFRYAGRRARYEPARLAAPWHPR